MKRLFYFDLSVPISLVYVLYRVRLLRVRRRPLGRYMLTSHGMLNSPYTLVSVSLRLVTGCMFLRLVRRKEASRVCTCL